MRTRSSLHQQPDSACSTQRHRDGIYGPQAQAHRPRRLLASQRLCRSQKESVGLTPRATTMLFHSLSAALALGALPLLAAALPANTPATGAVAAKAHNIYLVTCVPKLKDDDDKTPTTTSNFTAVAYFKQPLNATDTSTTAEKAPKPDHAAMVSQPPEPWEGVKWKVKVWNDKTFSTDIAPDAKSLSKAAIAGGVQLKDEPYICFVDGDTAVRIREDAPLRGNCVADYWCAGLGKPDDNSD